MPIRSIETPDEHHNKRLFSNTLQSSLLDTV